MSSNYNFDDYWHPINPQSIIDWNECSNNVSLNNVVSQLHEQYYDFQIHNNTSPISYRLMYIDNKDKLSGLLIDLSLTMDFETRINFTILFCTVIKEYYPHIDIIDSFNTFQIQGREIFEKLGFFTFGDDYFSRDRNAIIGIPSTKGFVVFPKINKIHFYRWYFGENTNEVKTDENKTKKIYLILDSKNNLIKIGQSFYPKTREKTLQGISPEWDIITTWIAPISEEIYLHKEFATKRTRGEWFDLDYSDIKIIKEHMKKYKNCF